MNDVGVNCLINKDTNIEAGEPRKRANHFPPENLSRQQPNLKSQEIRKSKDEGKNLNNHFQRKRLQVEASREYTSGAEVGRGHTVLCYKHVEMAMFSWPRLTGGSKIR